MSEHSTLHKKPLKIKASSFGKDVAARSNDIKENAVGKQKLNF